MSYRLCSSHLVAWAGPLAIAVPAMRPLAAPTAAPVPGWPEAAPIAAPKPAPANVPMAAPLARVLLAASLGDTPICCAAYCLHTASSAWNASKDFPGPGNIMTLGPFGTVAHPPSTTTPNKSIKPCFQFILPCPALLPGAESHLVLPSSNRPDSF
jgi:hypothetical protein